MTVTEIIKGLEKELYHADYHDLDYEDNVPVSLLKNAYTLIINQQAEIERLKRENKILSINADNAFQDGLNEAQDLYAEQVKNEVQAEAIKEFADSFDDELAKLRDTYFERGLKDYSLVCEVIHDYLYRTLREMVGDKNE